MSTAEELRTAAAKFREMAKPASRGPWVAFATLGDRQGDGHAWSITRPYCDNGHPCEPDCGDTVLTVGAEGCEDDNVTEANAAWMAFASPDLAEPLAALLDQLAVVAERAQEGSKIYAVEFALDIARALNPAPPSGS